MGDEPDQDAPPYHLTLPEWPELAFGDERIDGLIPTCRIKHWPRFQTALSGKLFNPPGADLIYRGQRRQEWQLTPTLARYSKLGAGVVDEKRAEQQKREFRLAMRGRGIGPELLDDDNELWAFGQHNGLATPLLDWTKSPFVALFFAFADPDFSYEDPNPSRAIFVINKTALDALDENLIVQPMRNDHARLVNQAGLFTISPLGSDTLTTRIFNLLSETQTINMDDPQEVGRFIFKIHIPNDERRECLNMLRKMNIHHGSLFPDPIGASLYCNEWVGGRADEPEIGIVPEAPKRSSPKPKPRPATTPRLSEIPPAASASMTTSLAHILRSAGVEAKQASTLAAALAAKFNASAPIDWTGRAFGSASVNVETKRVLRMNGIPSESVDSLARLIFEYFASLATDVDHG